MSEVNLSERCKHGVAIRLKDCEKCQDKGYWMGKAYDLELQLAEREAELAKTDGEKFTERDRTITELSKENRSLEAVVDRYRKALENIRDKDYRGNRCSCSGIAKKTLAEGKKCS